MKILITGGSGFIGSHLAERALARGDAVVVVDNYVTGRRDNLARASGAEIHEGDVADREFIGGVIGDLKPDVIVHAAASYKDPDDWAADARTNTLGTALVAQAAAEAGTSRLIYLQTALCYGLHPLEQPISLSHPLRPGGSSYAISKTAGEHYIELSGVEWQSFRLANAYGPRNLSGPLPTFYSRLTSDRPCFVMDTRRDFVFVDDVVDVLAKATYGVGRPGAYHIASGADFSIEELYRATLMALGMPADAPVEVRPRGQDDAATILLDPSDTEADFNWEVRTPLIEGVRRAIEYYEAHGIGETYTHLRPPASLR